MDAMPSGDVTKIVPVVESEPLPAAEPGVSTTPLVRVPGKPASPTLSTTSRPAGPPSWITTSGSRSIRPGTTSCNSGFGNANAVGGNKSPNANGSPMSPTASAKLPPELCGGPAAGCGSCPINNAAKLSAGMATPSTTICGTKMAPSGTIICVPSGIWIIRSRPTTLISSRPMPAGKTS